MSDIQLRQITGLRNDTMNTQGPAFKYKNISQEDALTRDGLAK